MEYLVNVRQYFMTSLKTGNYNLLVESQINVDVIFNCVQRFVRLM